MKAILLAAGKGSRISKSIPNVPKCTLDIGGIPLIIRTIEMLLKNGIEVTIVVGYLHKVIENLIQEHGLDVHIVYNPFFDVTNSIGSLWMAKEYLIDDDTIVANADVFWEQEILTQILRENKGVFLLSDRLRAEDGDYFFYEEYGRILKYGKQLKREERNCEYVGIAYIEKSFIDCFRGRLIEKIENQEHGLWWEDVLYSFIDSVDVYAVDVNGKFWAEVDFIEDYNRIIKYVRDKGEY